MREEHLHGKVTQDRNCYFGPSLTPKITTVTRIKPNKIAIKSAPYSRVK